MWQSHLASLSTEFWNSISIIQCSVFPNEHWLLPYFFQQYSTAQFKTEFTELWVMQTAFWEIGFLSRDGDLGDPKDGWCPEGHLQHNLPTGQAQFLLGNICWISERTWQCSYHIITRPLWGIPNYQAPKLFFRQITVRKTKKSNLWSPECSDFCIHQSKHCNWKQFTLLVK